MVKIPRKDSTTVSKKSIHIFILIVFFVGCFFAGIWLNGFIEKYFQQGNTRDEVVEVILGPTTSETGFETHIDPIIATSAEIKNVIDQDLKPSIDTDHPDNLDSQYKRSRRLLLDSYNSGQRDQKTVQLRLYLASLENDMESYKQVSDEWCREKPSECASAKMPIVARGRVLDVGGSPIVGAHLFFSGEEGISVKTNTQGYYSITLETLNPRRLRLIVQHPTFSGGSYTFVTVDPRLTIELQNQIIEKNFTLVSAVQKIVLDTVSKKIISGDALVTQEGYLIENEFSKYLVPFESIRTRDDNVYTGRVTVHVFEFNRQTANEFLLSDVMSEVYGFASEGLQTYSMPLIFFYDEKGARLEVFKKTPMTVWTTNRELAALISENAQDIRGPGFNPAQYEEALSPENVERYIKEDETKAYQESQKNPDLNPITLDWIYKNYSRLPSFFVYDQSTGLWEAVGYSLVAPSTDIKHSIRSHFWTKV